MFLWSPATEQLLHLLGQAQVLVQPTKQLKIAFVGLASPATNHTQVFQNRGNAEDSRPKVDFSDPPILK
jgi:hypothetical protein